MKEKVNVNDYANLITKALPKGILLNTQADKGCTYDDKKNN